MDIVIIMIIMTMVYCRVTHMVMVVMRMRIRW